MARLVTAEAEAVRRERIRNIPNMDVLHLNTMPDVGSSGIGVGSLPSSPMRGHLSSPSRLRSTGANDIFTPRPVGSAAPNSSPGASGASQHQQRLGSSGPAAWASPTRHETVHVEALPEALVASPSRQLPLRSPRQRSPAKQQQQQVLPDSPFTAFAASGQHKPVGGDATGAQGLQGARSRMVSLEPVSHVPHVVTGAPHALPPLLTIPSALPDGLALASHHNRHGAAASPLFATMMAALQDMQAGGVSPAGGRVMSSSGLEGEGTDGLSPDFSSAAAAAVRRRQKLREAASKASVPPPPLLIFESSLGLNSKVKGMLNETRSVSNCLRSIEKDLLPVAHSRKR